MTKERQVTNNEIGGADVREYPETRRVKTVFFDHPTDIDTTMCQLHNSCQRAESLFLDPLVQERVIMRVSEQQDLLTAVHKFSSFSTSAQVVGRIPFKADGEVFAIYTIHCEHRGRPSYVPSSSISYEDTIRLGVNRRRQHMRPLVLPDGFSLYAIEFINGTAHDVLQDTHLTHIDQEQLAEELALTHRKSFPYVKYPIC